MTTDDKRDLFYYRQSPTLFLCITNKCNLNCEFCYIHDKKDYIEPDLGDLIGAIEEVKPGKLVVTGGEPMLYPNKVLGVMNYFEAEFRRHWKSTICTNLLYEITDLHKQTLNKFHYLQTTYHANMTKEQLLLWKNNFVKTINECNNIEKYDIIITIPENEEISTNVITDLMYICPDGISFEILSFNDNKDHNEYYERADSNILSLSRELEKYDSIENLLFSSWKRAIDSNMGLHCTVCNDGYCKVFENNKITNGCICNTQTHKRDKTKLTMCIQCPYFKYCRLDCERFGNECAFPKKTFEYFLKVYNMEG